MKRGLFVILSVVVLLAPTAASGQSAEGAGRFVTAPSSGVVDPVVLPVAFDDSRVITVMVEMAGDPVAVVQAKAGRELSAAEKQAIKAALKRRQDAAIGQIQAKGGIVRSQMQSAYNGMRVDIARNQAASLATIPNVIAIHGVQRYTFEHETSVPYLGIPAVWGGTGYTGVGIKVAIIDTGIDYTHANFGGPGTVAAYEAADATDTAPADPALFGPNAPRIKGGWDFVGDDYNANDPASVPVPDPNPLDCNGHGSHVAGTAGGSGVNPDGSTYTGPYDATTFTNDFLIGPGVAPQTDLYALRVFGCEGSTNVTTEAIDWAVDNGMDVINMSLGSSFGRADDPSAEAATNASAAGVVVVASAGNSGPSPYITGAPGSGSGVISVAAVDSNETFPAALITLASGTTITAINANGAVIPAGSYEVVYLTDDPATPDNDAVGCAVDDFTAAGISSDPAAPLQMAVTVRGTCARVAKAIYGQQAGADAVAMINTDAGYPPYEGEIKFNPDTGEPYLVTIPFLGVRGVLGEAPTEDGDILAAADGQQATLEETAPIVNPNYRGFASFSSGGPRNGDSYLKPNVAAPGVSIFSTLVGSGFDGGYNSGTSMAAPHVAGVAALAVQAHPSWAAQDIGAAISNGADPSGMLDYKVSRGGTGLVDADDAVNNMVVAYGDRITAESGVEIRDVSLSFGFAELGNNYRDSRVLTVANKGSAAVTLALGSEASPQSVPASVSFSSSTVTVPAGGQARVTVSLNVPVATAGSSVTGEGQFSFFEASGNITLSSGDMVLRVPYYLVPRALSTVNVTLNSAPSSRVSSVTATVTNRGPIAGSADFYNWGLEDPDDINEAVLGWGGYDVRALGVQSFDVGDGEQLLVFAINNHSRWSNAAVNEFDVDIDTNGDGRPEYIVVAIDSGAIRTGSFNGIVEVFIYVIATGELLGSGFLAASPTDSSTLLLPVYASDLGLRPNNGQFSYGATSFSLEGAGVDVVNGRADYNPWDPAFATGQYVVVAPGQSTQVVIPIDANNYRTQRTLGIMVVAIDNASGAGEAILLRGSR
ncbi:MAG: S8 family serine peptidase [Acidimicrobiia bacterium]